MMRITQNEKKKFKMFVKKVRYMSPAKFPPENLLYF